MTEEEIEMIINEELDKIKIDSIYNLGDDQYLN